MSKKKILFFCTFFMLIGCGYSPLYKNLSNIDFKNNLKNISGDRDLNNFVKSNISQYMNKESAKIFEININSKYEKITVSRSVTGTATNYELRGTISFDVSSEDINRKIVLKESVTIKKMENIFDEENYEKNVKQNFANSITRRLFLMLTQIK